MLKNILSGFWGSKSGRQYLIVFIVVLVGHLAFNLTKSYSPNTIPQIIDYLYLFLPVSLILVTIKYAYAINSPIWVIIILILLLFIPIGTWVTFFYLAGKTYSPKIKEDTNVTPKEVGRQEVEDNN